MHAIRRLGTLQRGGDEGGEDGDEGNRGGRGGPLDVLSVRPEERVLEPGSRGAQTTTLSMLPTSDTQSVPLKIAVLSCLGRTHDDGPERW